MPARRRPLPPPLTLPFTLPQGLAAGLTRDRLRGRDLAVSSRAIRVPHGAEPTLIDRCRPYVVLLPGVVVSHTTAARIHNLPLPARLETDAAIHLSRAPTEAAPRRRGVQGHRLALDASEVLPVAGIPVTSVARTWRDLAGLLTLDELVVAGDHIVSEYRRSFGPPRLAIVSLAELTAYVWSPNGGCRTFNRPAPHSDWCAWGWTRRLNPGCGCCFITPGCPSLSRTSPSRTGEGCRWCGRILPAHVLAPAWSTTADTT
jgi:hypothetical protein